MHEREDDNVLLNVCLTLLVEDGAWQWQTRCLQHGTLERTHGLHYSKSDFESRGVRDGMFVDQCSDAAVAGDLSSAQGSAGATSYLTSQLVARCQNSGLWFARQAYPGGLVLSEIKLTVKTAAHAEEEGISKKGWTFPDKGTQQKRQRAFPDKWVVSCISCERSDHEMRWASSRSIHENVTEYLTLNRRFQLIPKAFSGCGVSTKVLGRPLEFLHYVLKSARLLNPSATTSRRTTPPLTALSEAYRNFWPLFATMPLRSNITAYLMLRQLRPVDVFDSQGLSWRAMTFSRLHFDTTSISSVSTQLDELAMTQSGADRSPRVSGAMLSAVRPTTVKGHGSYVMGYALQMALLAGGHNNRRAWLPQTVTTTAANTARIDELIQGDQRRTIRDIASDVSLTNGITHDIILDKFHYRKACASRVAMEIKTESLPETASSPESPSQQLRKLVQSPVALSPLHWKHGWKACDATRPYYNKKLLFQLQEIFSHPLISNCVPELKNN
ncbi:hypothetical protein PR048_002958 [Dryococelus australis]|uniref:Uncharacterized protein n=1 Tax=Dryococelus australis TaxID=614101 RepID=A0ABQ9IN31_9NEOP|nr:hypothetical protein PR048_002958 [Dryococelus australis]